MKIRLWAALLWLGAPMALWAQASADSLELTELDEVVVSDSRFPRRRELSGKTVIRLGPAELAGYAGLSVAEVLNRQAGLELSGSRGRPGEVLGVYARGGRGRQVLILIDGVRVSDPSSFSQGYDLRLLSPDQVASIEILKGASSTLYGSNAATAVISITTRQAGPAAFGLEAGGRLATLNPPDRQEAAIGLANHFASLGGTVSGWGYRASVSQQYAGGLSSLANTAGEKDPTGQWSADFSLGKAWDNGWSVRGFFSKGSLKSAYDDSFTGSDAPFRFESRQERAGVHLEGKGRRGSLTWHAAYAGYDSEDFSDFPFSYAGTSLTSDLFYRRELAPGVSTLAGLALTRDAAEGESYLLTDPYVNLVLGTPNGWNLNTGARLNVHSAYGAHGVYSLNPSRLWRVGNGYLKGMASWSTAYITPSLTQLYGVFGANPDLEPESNQGLEGGVEWHLNDPYLYLSLLYFQRREKNAVVYDGALSQYFNAAGTTQARGLELEARGRLSKGLSFRLHYTYTHRSGDGALRIPKHKAGVRLDAALGARSRVSLDYNYTGARPDTDFSTFTPVTLKAFSLVDLRWQFTGRQGRFTGYLLASNLLNARFEEVLGYVTPGRNVGLGWNLRLE